MTVYCCARCSITLTFRSPEMRDREYCFPHSDDFRGCDVCGTMFCERCAVEFGPVCLDCGGRLHAGRRFDPTGEYRLPPRLRRMTSPQERAAWVEQKWKAGEISNGERRSRLHVIAELARGDAGPASPELQAKFDGEFRPYVERYTEPVVVALRALVAAPLPGGFELLAFYPDAEWSRFRIEVHAMDREAMHSAVGVRRPFDGKLLPAGPFVPTGAIDQYGYEAAGVRTYESGSRVIAEWFGECWEAADGAAFPLPAYVSLPDGFQYFDLHARRWIPREEIGGP